MTILPGVAKIDNPWKCTDSLNNTVKFETFSDTIYDSDLPSIEFRLGTYHNFGNATTVGFKVTLRGDEIEIKDAIFYKEASQADDVERVSHPIEPFYFNLDNSAYPNRIDCIYVQLKFPYSMYFSPDDSLVIITNKGNFTLYMGDEYFTALTVLCQVAGSRKGIENRTAIAVKLYLSRIPNLTCHVDLEIDKSHSHHRVFHILAETFDKFFPYLLGCETCHMYRSEHGKIDIALGRDDICHLLVGGCASYAPVLGRIGQRQIIY